MDDGGIARVLAISDGVFAFSLTLLVLGIVVPASTSSADAGDALASLGPAYFAFALTFWNVAVFWLAHRRNYARLARVDTRVVSLNFVFLAGIAFLPFPAGLVARYSSSTPVVVLYAATLASLSLVHLAAWIYASRIGRLLLEDTPPAVVRQYTARGAAALGVFIVALVASTLSAPLAIGLWSLGAPLAGAVTRRVYRA